jgi:hypothetical protein
MPSQDAAKLLVPGALETGRFFSHLPDSTPGLSPFVSLTPVGGSLSSRLEELRSESLSLSLETTGKTDRSRGYLSWPLLEQRGPEQACLLT